MGVQKRLCAQEIDVIAKPNYFSPISCDYLYLFIYRVGSHVQLYSYGKFVRSLLSDRIRNESLCQDYYKVPGIT